MQLKMERRRVDDLVPYHRNAKDHGDADIEAIARSIQRFGFNDPIGITPDGIIIEGHGRLAAARLLGLEEVPVLVIEGLTEEQADLYRIGHNKLALVSQFDFRRLYQLLNEITEGAEIDAHDMGFTDLGLSVLQMNFGIRERDDNAPTQAASKSIEYDVIWETKAERERMNAFLKELASNGAGETTASGDLLLAKIKASDPQLYAQLAAAVPGVTDLDLQAGDIETEAQHVA
jgi:hypothetical protein